MTNPSRPLTVLVVEDERVVSRDLQQQLVRLGYEVPQTAASAEEAIALAAERCPDLVLMDIHIEGERDGIQTATLLRERFEVPVVYLTAWADEATVARAKLTQPYGYLIKPIKPGELRTTLELALHRHGLDRAAAHRQQLAAQRTTESTRSERLGSLATLSGGVAHEVNNPLAAMLANTELLLEDLAALSASVEAGAATREVLLESLGTSSELLRELQQGGNRIRTIVGGLATFAQSKAPERTPTVLADALDWALRLEASAIEKVASLVHTAAPMPAVLGNHGQLAQVFNNLIVNATQAMASGRRDENQLTVVSGTAADGWAEVSIADTGLGMSTEQRAHAFDPFFTTREVGGGTGLGLSVCHGVVASLGGSIEVESEPGRGTTVRVRLPAAPAAAPRSAPTSVTARHGRVLVIDDEPSLASAVRRTLHKQHEVTVMTDPLEAAAWLQTRPQLELIICDLMMPKLPGMDLYEQVLSFDPALAKKFVFLTGGAVTERAADFLATVNNPVVDKPFEPAALRALVRQLVDAQAA